MKKKLFLVYAVLLLAAFGALVCWQHQARPKGRMPRTAAGVTHLVVIKSDGSLWAMGRNTFTVAGTNVVTGAVGDGTTVDRRRLVQISKDKDWAEVAAGEFFSLAVKTDGSLWGWGLNNGGQLGDGTGQNHNRPVKLSKDHDWAGIAAGATLSLGLKADGSLWAWGWNDEGQLGDDTNLARAPVRIGSANNWVSIAAGPDYSVACRADGSLWMWGQRLVPGESKPMAWLRQLVTRWKLPIKLPPPQTMDLLPVKIADLGRWELRSLNVRASAA